MTDDKTIVLLYGRFPEKIDNKPITEIPECNPNNENNWMGWTKKELEKKNFKVYCPTIPMVWQAPYSDWEKELDKIEIDNNTTIIGLSAGAGAATRYIVEKNRQINKLILVAPAILEPWPTNHFYDFTINDSIRNQIAKGTTIFYDPKDTDYIVKSVQIYKERLNAKLIDTPGYGHFSFLIQTFPELLNEILLVNGD